MANIKDWIFETQSKEDIEDIASHGCVNGSCSELIYYDDTVQFYDEHKEDIWELLEEETEGLGFDTIFELMGTWKDSAKMVNSDTQFKNLLSWWAVETVCYQITNA